MEISSKKLHPFLKALFISFCFLAFTLLTGVVWESDDDAAIALLLSRLDSDFSPFQWRLLSVILHCLYLYFPVINWWMACSVFAVWLGVLVVSYVVFQRYDDLPAFLICVFLALFAWLTAIYRVNFTRTAAIAAIAGCLLIADGIFCEKVSLWKYIVGCIVMLSGASIRSNCAIIALAFLAVIGADKLLSDHFSFRLSWFQTHMRQILLLCIAAALYFGASYIDDMLLTDEQEAYLEYNALRSSIQDYAHRYPAYEDAAEEYAAAGIDQHSLNVLIHWFSEDTEVFNKQTLEHISAMAVKKVSFDKVFPLPTDHTVLLGSAAALLVIAFLSKWNILHICATALMIALLCMYLAMGGRYPPRVFEPILWCALCSGFFLCAPAKPEKSRLRRIATAVLCCVLLIGSVALVQHIHTLLAEDGDNRNRTQQDAAAAEGRIILDAIDADTENLYIFDIFRQPTAMEDAFSCWEPRPNQYCDNHFVLGGWEVRHPYLVNLQEKEGITNPVTALYEKTNVYSMYSRRILTHLRIHYQNRITVSETAQLCGYPLVQYAMPIDDSALVFDADAYASLVQFQYSDKENSAWYLQANVTPLENGTGIFYCNITLNDMRYTYRLRHDNGCVSAYLFGPDETYDSASSDLQIFQLMADGSYVAYAQQG